MNGDQIIQRMATRIANLIVEVEFLKQENIELNQLLQTKQSEVTHGISNENN